jgi:hypothetical protein
MEIPLVLIKLRDGRLVYGIPLWYRLVMASIAALVAVSLAVSGAAPSLGGWIVLAIVALAACYEERWTFDASAGRITHRAGLLMAARSTTIEFAKIERFRIAPFVRGTIPGSEDEQAENAAALAGGRSDDGTRRRSFVKKPYLRLICEASDGASWLLDTVGARKIETLKMNAARIASYCGKNLIVG